MEKNKNRVFNYVVANKGMFCEYLARQLCKMEVNYVQIENEFHFCGRVYRFYNYDDSLDLCGHLEFVNDENGVAIPLNAYDLVFQKTEDGLSQFLKTEQSNCDNDTADLGYGERPKHKMYTKQMMRQANHRANQRLKNSHIQQGFRIRRNG